jgi:hypothetical protein
MTVRLNRLADEIANRFGDHSDRQVEGNAALLLAAPELLAALKVAADAIDYAQAQVDSENDRHNLLVRLAQVKRVIAKAEGGDA